MTEKTYQPDIIIYHSPCRDGFSAAWACWKRWGYKPTYFATTYGSEPPNVDGLHVLIVDFSYKRDVLARMAKQARSIIVLDHHKTAQEDLREWQVNDPGGSFWAGDDPMRFVSDHDERIGLPIAALFDMEKSGARLAWEFCHDAPSPVLIDLVEDRDLWRFKFELTKPVNMMLQVCEQTFEAWNQIDLKGMAAASTQGYAMLAYQDWLVAKIASNAGPSTMAGHTPLVVNCPPEISSEVCHWILDHYPKAPFAAAFSVNPTGTEIYWSLRSTDERIDVSAVAQSFGGGGHRNAAGFKETRP